VQQLGLQARVKMNGFVSARAVAQLIENADLGVVPKRTDGFGDEAFSTKIMEFMALGVPVIAPDSRVNTYYFNASIARFFEGGDEHGWLELCSLSSVSRNCAAGSPATPSSSWRATTGVRCKLDTSRWLTPWLAREQDALILRPRPLG